MQARGNAAVHHHWPRMLEKWREAEKFDPNRQFTPPKGEPYKPSGDPPLLPFPMGQGNMGAFPMRQDNSGVMGAMANNPMVQQAKGLYQKFDPWIPSVDGSSLGYSWEKPMFGGTLGYGMDYDWDDENAGAFINWKLGLGA